MKSTPLPVVLKVAKKRVGRPPKPIGEIRSERIWIPCKKKEIVKYRRAADRMGLTVSEWARSQLNALVDPD